jgi:hypothetical protein
LRAGELISGFDQNKHWISDMSMNRFSSAKNRVLCASIGCFELRTANYSDIFHLELMKRFLDGTDRSKYTGPEAWKAPLRNEERRSAMERRK